MKSLLVFAHRNEAHAFLENISDLKSVDNSGKFYENDELKIIITGEGIENALCQVSFHLGKSTISQVLNFGIAASLNRELDKYSIHKIRTVYQSAPHDMKFKSFSSINHDNLDCISANQRIFDKEKVKLLSHFGDILDRELWGIAFAANQQKIPFESYKMISDYALNHEECENIKAQGRNFSYTLFKKYQELQSQNLEEKKTNEFDDLYFTEAMRRQFNSLREKIERKFDSQFEDIINLDVLETIERPKDKTLKLLDIMKRELSPFQYEIHDQIEASLNPFRTEKIKINYDRSLESAELSVQIKASSPGELLKQIGKIEHLPFQKITALIQGEKDV